YEGTDGTLSAKLALPAGARRVRFRVTGGIYTDSSGTLASPDGMYPDGTNPYNFSGTRWNGTYEGVPVGGSTGPDPGLFGVFFSPNLSGTPADSLDYRSDSGSSPDPRTLPSSSPTLNQPFYLGDGYSGNNPFQTTDDQFVPPGSQQVFNVPQGASHLLLGFGA